MLTRYLATRLDALVFGSTYRSVSSAVTAFGALAFPSVCVMCGRWDTSLCESCSASFRSDTARPFRAEEAAESLPDVQSPTSTGQSPTSTGRMPPYRPLPVVAAGRYGRGVPAVMLAFKNHGHVDLAAPLAAALAGALHEALTGGAIDSASSTRVLLVPVPSRAAARRRRGYDPLMMLLTQLDRGGRLPVGTLLAPWVRHVPPVMRITADLREGRATAGSTARNALASTMSGGQKGAGKRRRRTNVLHSMALPSRRVAEVEGRACLIIDDVLTTGATIGEVHRVLSAAGARVIGAVVVAATRSPSAAAEPPEVSRRQEMNNGGA